jgi:uncharacterized protein
MGKAQKNKVPAVIAKHQAELERLCREYGVERLEVFGSAVSGDFDPDRSDLDFLIEFQPGVDLGHWMKHFFAFEDELKALFERDVDLVFPKGIRNPYLKRNIDATRLLLYAA